MPKSFIIRKRAKKNYAPNVFSTEFPNEKRRTHDACRKKRTAFEQTKEKRKKEAIEKQNENTSKVNVKA